MLWCWRSMRTGSSSARKDRCSTRTASSSVRHNWRTMRTASSSTSWRTMRILHPCTCLHACCMHPPFRCAADPHQIVRFEWMHVIELGWIPMLLAAIKQYADNRNMNGAALLATLDRELEQLPRFEGFYLPTGRTFFSAPSFVQARDYKAVMQVRSWAHTAAADAGQPSLGMMRFQIALFDGCGVRTAAGRSVGSLQHNAHNSLLFLLLRMQVLPHLINGKVDAALTDIMCHAQQLFMAMYTRNEAPVYTEQSLNSIRSSMQQLINKIHTHMPHVNTLTPKVHALVHFPEDVTDTGHPKHSNSDSWEKDHVWVKRAHK